MDWYSNDAILKLVERYLFNAERRDQARPADRRVSFALETTYHDHSLLYISPAGSATTANVLELRG
jgi:hypothetical protein